MSRFAMVLIDWAMVTALLCVVGIEFILERTASYSWQANGQGGTVIGSIGWCLILSVLFLLLDCALVLAINEFSRNMVDNLE